jgi:hypothetical protein
MYCPKYERSLYEKSAGNCHDAKKCWGGWGLFHLKMPFNSYPNNNNKVKTKPLALELYELAGKNLRWGETKTRSRSYIFVNQTSGGGVSLSLL